jgi:hypothetical protein
VDRTAARFEVLQRTTRVTQIRDACVRERDRAARAVEQRRVQRVLELPDLLRKCRLRDMQLSRRASEIAVTGDRDEIAGVAQKHKQRL